MASRASGLECTLAATRGTATRVPFNPFVMHLAATMHDVDYTANYCENPATLSRCQLGCARFFGIDSVNVSTDAYREASAWGVPVRLDTHTPMPAPGGHLDWRLFHEIETPDVHESPRTAARIEAVRLLKQAEPEACVIGWIEAPFAELVSLFDMTNVITLITSREGRDALGKILDRVVAVQIAFAKAQVEAGADIIGAGDSAVSQFGPNHYKNVALEPTTTLFHEISKHVPVLYHACGDNDILDKAGNDMLVLLASTGASVLDIDSQVNLTSAKDRIGKTTCLRGNVSTTVLGTVHNDPGRVMQEIQHAITMGKGGGHYMFAAGCEWPWVPVSLAARNMGIAKAIIERDGAY